MSKTRKRIRVTDLNPNLICVLCGGYFIDATTLTECLHSFCKTCIVKYLDTSKHCPVCDVMVHKTRPHLHIRSDKTLQDLVYKLVPGLYKNEMKRRRDYYTQHPREAPRKVGEDRGDENAERILYTEDEKFSVSLHFSSQGVKDERTVRTLTLPEVGTSTSEPPKNVRYLECPAGVTVDILKKFVRLKYELPLHYQIDIFHTEESLRSDFTLMDVAYIYTWRRKEPLKLHFSVYEYIAKRRKLDQGRKRLLDLNNLVKLQTKNLTAKAASKPDKKPSQSHLKTLSSTSSKLSKQGDKVRKVEWMDVGLVTEELRVSGTGDVKPSGLTKLTSSAGESKRLAEDVVKTGVVTSSPVKEERTASEKSTAELEKKPDDKSLALSGLVPDREKLNSVKRSSPVLTKTNYPASSTLSAAGSAKVSVCSAAVVTTISTTSSSQSSLSAFAGRLSDASTASTLPQTPSSKKEAVPSQPEAGASQTTPDNLGRKSVLLQTPAVSSAFACTIAATSASAASATCMAVTMATMAEATSVTQATPKKCVTSSRLTSKPPLATRAPNLLPVPVAMNTTVPSAAAAAAGAVSPSPAALAASSSPSPPMASSAASVKDTEQTRKHASSLASLPAVKAAASAARTETVAFSKPSVSAVLSLPTLVSSTSSKAAAADSGIKPGPKPESAAQKTDSTSSADSSSSAAVCASSASLKDVQLPSSRDVDKSAVSNKPNEVCVDRVPDGSVKRSENNVENKAAASETQGKVDKHKSCIGAESSSSSSNGQKVATSGRSAVSSAQTSGPLSGRNGMPAMVTKPTRVINASTSVNTLLQKPPVSSSQRSVVKSSETPSLVCTRPCGTASPISKLSASEAVSKQSPTQSKTLIPNSKELSKASSGASSELKQPYRRTGIATSVSVPSSRSSVGSSTIQTSRPVMASSAAALPVQPTRPSSASTPVPIQPQPQLQPMITNSQLIESMADCSPVAVAMRRANQIQIQQVLAHHAKQQQQLFELYSIHAALAARYGHLQTSQLASPAGHLLGPTAVGIMAANSQPSAQPHSADSTAKQAVEHVKKQRQSLPAGRKTGEASTKKKISDIANSLHKKISQTLGTKVVGSRPSSDKRPPNAHVSATPKLGAGGGGGGGDGLVAARTPATSSTSKVEDEPLNLVMARNTPASKVTNSTVSIATKPEGEK